MGVMVIPVMVMVVMVMVVMIGVIDSSDGDGDGDGDDDGDGGGVDDTLHTVSVDPLLLPTAEVTQRPCANGNGGTCTKVHTPWVK